jgi:hypothetical protein
LEAEETASSREMEVDLLEIDKPAVVFVMDDEKYTT